jgi:hypothetical protein
VSRRFVVALVGLTVLAVAMVGVARITGRDGAKPHPLGTEVLVGHRDFSGGQPGVRTRIGLTVLAVRKGTQDELAANGLEVEPADRSATPFYIDARFTNRGPNAVERTLTVGLEDSEGNLVASTLFFGLGSEPFELCPRITEGTLKPGESYESCTLVLVPDGVEPAKVEFLSDRGPDEEPEFVYWAVE